MKVSQQTHLTVSLPNCVLPPFFAEGGKKFGFFSCKRPFFFYRKKGKDTNCPPLFSRKMFWRVEGQLGGFVVMYLKKKIFDKFFWLDRNFCPYEPSIFDYYFWETKNLHKNQHIFGVGFKNKTKKSFFLENLFGKLMSCKYGYGPVNRGKISPSKFWSWKSPFLGGKKTKVVKFPYKWDFLTVRGKNIGNFFCEVVRCCNLAKHDL